MMEQQDPYKAPETPAPENKEEPKRTVETVRAERPAANPKLLDDFRVGIARRHTELDTILGAEDVKLLPFLEQEFIRIQRDALRAVLVAANLQAECIAQNTGK